MQWKSAIRKIQIVPELAGRVNTQAAEQLFAGMRKNNYFLKMMSPTSHMFLVRNILHMQNKEKMDDFIHHTVTSINHPSFSHRRHEMFHASNDFCTVINNFMLQMCFCISARLYLIVSRHCSVQFIWSSRLSS